MGFLLPLDVNVRERKPAWVIWVILMCGWAVACVFTIINTLAQRDAPTSEVSILKGNVTLPEISICWEDSILKYYGTEFDSPILAECVSSDWTIDALGPASFPAPNASLPSFDRSEESTCNVTLALGETNWWDCYEGPGNCVDQCLSFDTSLPAFIEDFPDFFAGLYFNRSAPLQKLNLTDESEYVMPINQLKAYLHYGPPNDDGKLTGSTPVFIPMNAVTTVTISMSIRFGLDGTQEASFITNSVSGALIPLPDDDGLERPYGYSTFALVHFVLDTRGVEKVVEKDPVTITGIVSQMGGLFPFVATAFGIFFTIKEDGKAKKAGAAKKKSDDSGDGGDDDDSDLMTSAVLTSPGGLKDMMSLDNALKFGYKKVLPALGHWFIGFFRSKKVQPAEVKPLKAAGVKAAEGKPAPGGVKLAAESAPGESVPGTVIGSGDAAAAAAPGKVNEIRNEIRKYGARETPLLDVDGE
ncbi:hypothetical protein KFL_000110070 [Klebsormidium nitens]|uniref:Uncharacterized protein n=1 Tax=Klebsormidium nitens TaxID=105231 RepID=A0A1Y1HMT9_KLENI|nr:hypothetical protein KFL_000110070 [Klebsormidium nitens]|eukprot:GAQ78311.1 hypothetical protein KFL_000110070 [Klebsormidium nitens]